MNYFNTSLLVICGLLLSVQCFLLNTNKPPSSIGTLGNDTIAYMEQRMNLLQTQIQLQNHTLKNQALMIEQLLNISKQTPSTQTLSNELSVLQIYVQRIMDEYHRLSNISDATDLALKINNMTNPVKYLTLTITKQEQKDTELSQQITSLTSDLHNTKSTLSTLQTTVSHNQQYSSSHISSLTNQYSALLRTLQNTNTRVSTLEHNLETTAITGVRLIGGYNSAEGRLEVKYNGSWGTVCDDSFSDNVAKVVCRQLGYLSVFHATHKDSAAYGRGSGNIVLDDVSCRGDETSLALCNHNAFLQNNCDHGEDVGIICFDIRLVGGNSSREGRVEVRLGNTWGTVCDDSWDDNDARVVCRTLGFSSSGSAYSNAHFGEGSGPTWMDNVNCGGGERSLALCPFNGFGHEDCGHSEDAGVICHCFIQCLCVSNLNNSLIMNYINTSLFVICGLLLSVQCFLMNTNKPPSNIGTVGNDSIAYMDQRINHLQTQIQFQNNTLQNQAFMIDQLLNISKQTPSTQTLSNELSVLQVYVQRIMDEYHRLSNVSDATDLALKINNIANSLRYMTVSLNKQEQKDAELTSRITSLEHSLSSVNQSVTSLSVLERQNENKLTSLSNALQTTNNTVNSLQGTLLHVSSQISTLTNQYSAISSKVSNLSSDFYSIKNTVNSLQTTVSQNHQYSFSHISSLTNQYYVLSGTIQNTTNRVSTMEQNLNTLMITDVRLRGGDISAEGRLEVNFRNSWGTVCDDSFNDNDARVACRQLGYNSAHATFKNAGAAYGRGTNHILLDDVSCRGDEPLLALCNHAAYGHHDCGHDEDIGVICFDIRLVGGSSSREGRVEVKLGNTWGTVCDDSWDDNDARVVCRTLGFSGSGSAYSNAHFGEGSGQIWMDDVNCGGGERSLALCPFNGFGNENCGHSEDAGVVCH
ncbi:deleted in malignant brain tumors 1 protein-like [Saccostrea cucullata]|uniref:deleted in malignant brain tumors 1 protein-like n=1 Tax=Saccostrea cuccullata TaxID=36930 RepID=UPI002ED419DE